MNYFITIKHELENDIFPKITVRCECGLSLHYITMPHCVIIDMAFKTYEKNRTELVL